jgi:hypothetical protein
VLSVFSECSKCLNIAGYGATDVSGILFWIFAVTKCSSFGHKTTNRIVDGSFRPEQTVCSASLRPIEFDKSAAYGKKLTEEETLSVIAVDRLSFRRRQQTYLHCFEHLCCAAPVCSASLRPIEFDKSAAYGKKLTEEEILSVIAVDRLSFRRRQQTYLHCFEHLCCAAHQSAPQGAPGVECTGYTVGRSSWLCSARSGGFLTEESYQIGRIFARSQNLVQTMGM